MSITITHTPEEGTIARGDTRPHAATFKTYRWRWARTLTAWYIPNSRDLTPKRWQIDPIVTALETAGESVTLDLSDERTSTADRVANQAERAEVRQERLESRADHADATAAAHDAAAKRISDFIPFGQPILIGHHSERGHRRDIGRIERSMDKMCEALDKSEHASRQLEASTRHQAHKMTGPATMRRLERLNTELRDITRKLEQATSAGNTEWRDRLLTFDADLTEQITYWTGHLEALKAQGWHQWTPGDFTKGESVMVRGTVRQVVRINKKSLSVTSGYSWTDTITYDERMTKLPA